ncbi:MAG: N-acetylmuramoyl-L-alanine amidase [Anaerolineae bacterium]|nr:N-acetylmuramoyl-L-alanine amidase [Anaerolineae bacterium]
MIAIDPGHGGLDVGAPHYNASGEIDFSEKEINLALALNLREKLVARGYQVVLTRDGDYMLNEEGEDVNGNGTVEYLDELQARVDLVNAAEADLLLSIHQNAFYWEDGSLAPDIGGSVTFYCKDRPFSEASLRLAELVQEHLVETFRNLGHVMMARDVEDDLALMTPGEPGSHLVLLGPESARIARASQMPGVLSETVFITHAREARLICDPAVQDLVAVAYADAIAAYLAEGSSP